MHESGLNIDSKLFRNQNFSQKMRMRLTLNTAIQGSPKNMSIQKITIISTTS